MSHCCNKCLHYRKSYSEVMILKEGQPKERENKSHGCAGNSPTGGIMDISERTAVCALFKDLDGNKPTPKPQDDKYKDWTNAELKAKLDECGVAYKAKDTKAKLIKLLTK